MSAPDLIMMTGSALVIMLLCVFTGAALVDIREKRFVYRQLHAEALRDQERREAIEAGWRKRCETGYVLTIDDRLCLTGVNVKTYDKLFPIHTFRIDVYRWCRSNLSHKYSFVPLYEAADEPSVRIWFENENDALHFKMKWF